MSEDYTDYEVRVKLDHIEEEVEEIRIKISGFIKLKSGKLIRMIPEVEEKPGPKTGRSFQ